jgi:RNA chaperone Hfq
VTDPKASDSGGAGEADPPMPKNEQFASLNRLRRERTWVDVFLIGGTCLHGQIRSFDASMMLLQTRSGDIGLYHHAISTVVRAQKRGKHGRGRPPQLAPNAARPPAVPEEGEAPPRPASGRTPVVIVKQRRARTLIKPPQ